MLNCFHGSDNWALIWKSGGLANSHNQRKWVEKENQEFKKRGGKPRFWSTKYAANADYLIFWAQAQGFRPYVYYVPRTEKEEGRVSGNYSSYGSQGYNWGTFNGRVTVERVQRG